jgi:hypothetical protein
MIMINNTNELKKVFLELMSNIPIMRLYRKGDTYLWN